MRRGANEAVSEHVLRWHGRVRKMGKNRLVIGILNVRMNIVVEEGWGDKEGVNE